MSDIKPKPKPITAEQKAELRDLSKQLDEMNLKTDKTPDEELKYWFKDLDYKHFGGKLSKSNVEVKWCNKLHVTPGKVDDEDEISRKLLESRPKSELVEVLHLYMEKANLLVMEDDWENKEEKRKKELMNKRVAINPISFVKQHLVNNVNKEVDPNAIELEKKSLEILVIESKSLIDERLEELDPKPDLQEMFKRYDKQYFDGILTAHNVEVNWSTELVGLLGLTKEATAIKPIQMSISVKVLSSRKNTVETLLHEMIHAFLFAKDLELGIEHGPKFHQMAKEVHKKTGANPLSDTCGGSKMRSLNLK